MNITEVFLKRKGLERNEDVIFLCAVSKEEASGEKVFTCRPFLL